MLAFFFQEDHVEMAAVVMLEPQRVAVVVHRVQEKHLIRDDSGRPVFFDVFHQGTVSGIIYEMDIHCQNAS